MNEKLDSTFKTVITFEKYERYALKNKYLISNKNVILKLDLKKNIHA